jgi:ABC-2 type transport system permease protein
MTVLRRFLEDRIRSNFWWLVGIAGLTLFSLAFYPSVKDSHDIDDVVKNMPAAVQSMLGLENGISISSAPGYLQARLFASTLPVLLLVLAVSTGSAAIGGSEEDGALEFLLSNPVTRRRIVIERYLGLALVLLVQVALFTVIAFAGAAVFDALSDVSSGGMLSTAFGAGTLALLHGSVAFTVGAWTGRRGPAIAAAGAVAAAGYLAHGLLTAVDVPTALRAVSPWYWYLHENQLAVGANVWSWLPALLLSVALGASAILGFQRRDLN